ncbi:putative prolyl 4-hydroxylase alpha subunit [Heterostelium album PN500]|uniref:Putative prolyl 4-hydroxylase alpha subunit n=1 Tax=Heterostelium pallidum (strain ATCC 26659 / Pp 5 / PN500) TaxID=670386 RepID=D3BNC0_HETP5|nr:putative prolyl 4-hydroxylase alpha subunit [Heterostelium album PN500]EFA76780.1 putative prolyl 4-hydroxylase alpha subunit [Heterostelium album PN500]|eukprot:XP_020428912.1 putative prolyl 4-hydroxylase alpha subunit [Heterostelium album PN500]
MTSAVEDVVLFASLGYGELRLAKKYATRDRLERLFQTQGGLIMVDSNGEEVFPKDSEAGDQYYDIDSNKTYTIVSEVDLLSDTEDDQDEIGDDNVISEEDYLEEDDEDDESVELVDDETTTNLDSLSIDDSVQLEQQVEQQQQQQVEQQEQHQHTTQCGHGHGHSHAHAHDNAHAHAQTEVIPTIVGNESQAAGVGHHHNHDDACSDCSYKQRQAMDAHQKLLRMREERINMIKELYQPLHKEIFKFSEDFLCDNLVNAIKQYKITNNPDDLLKPLTKLTDTRIYSLQIFKTDFCQKLLEEIDQFKNSGLPTARPNSMNNYGVILDEMGFTGFFTELRENYLKPFTSVLYADYNGAQLDSHHAFVVQYKIDKEKELGFHYDESDVTLNLCLGKQFTGGSLYFRGILDKPETHQEYFEVKHTPGTALLHIGVHRHGALGITSGERTNLIMWLRNTGGKSDVL